LTPFIRLTLSLVVLVSTAVLPAAWPTRPHEAVAGPLTVQQTEVWVLVLEPTVAYSMSMEPAWIAPSGEWYRVLTQEDNWVLAHWESDPPESLVWIELTQAVALETVLGNALETVQAVAPELIPTVVLPTPPVAVQRRGPIAPYVATSPEYGVDIFIWDQPRTTSRDLGKLTGAGFTWQKSLFQWKLIEPAKGRLQWSEAERVVKASNAQGIKVIARVDFQPNWARSDTVHNGPPDNYEDYGAFIYALVDHFKLGAGNGVIDAIELWNEPNLSREWGNAPISADSAADYVRLMCAGHHAAKRASSHIVTISAGLSPTGTLNSEAADDTTYLQWMYDAGARDCFDVLGGHGAGYKAPPWIGPEELASDARWGGHSSFGFRRIEMLRDVMVKNGDEAKQVWLLEFGWTSDSVHEAYAWHRVTEDEKATYIVEAYRWAAMNWAPWIGVMMVWNLAAPEWTTSREEYWWSITAPDGSNRPAYEALLRARRDGYLIGMAR
jgi:polysaccharide biosynthesis protein PslG